MNVPLKWATGDRCVVQRDELLIGVITSINDECASVQIGESCEVFVGVDELKLVPLLDDADELDAFIATHDEREELIDAQPLKTVVRVEARSPKKRATPAFDLSVSLIAQIFDNAKLDSWSPKKLRGHLRDARCACPAVWRRAMKHVIGVSSRELPDLRQQAFMGGGVVTDGLA